MAKRDNFTAGRVEGFLCTEGKQQSIYWDGKTPGLGVRVTAAGSKSYVFETQLHGKTMRITIGDVKTWPLDAPAKSDKKSARSEATRLKALTDQGIDPRQQKAEQRAKVEAKRQEAVRNDMTIGEAWAVYLAVHEKRWGARHLIDHRKLSHPGGQTKKRGKGLTVPGVLHPLMGYRFKDITAPLLTEWLAKEAKVRANNARQGFQMFRNFWRWCATHEEYSTMLDVEAVNSRDLRAEVPSRKTKRFDVLQRSHLPDWFAAVRGLSNPVISAYLQGLMLTGARREELADLKWADTDFKWGVMWVHDKVREEGRKIPLTPYLSALLSALPRRNEWVFSSPSAANGRIQEPRSPHNRALDVAGVPYVTLHGLRRTFASLAEWVEMPQGVVAQIMGHAPSATAERHYINRPLELLAVWHSKYETWILEQAGIQFAADQGVAALRLVSNANA